ncbi:hypothetical protein MMC30_001553 [Trapelia coarctata]|nr:hypothetical protein [Trapelia coarctata]
MPLGSLLELVARMWTHPIPSRVRTIQLPRPHLAVLCNFVGIARNLVTGENVNEKATAKSKTVLHVAARINSKEMVEMLLEKQADRDLVNYSGKTPLDMILAAPLLRLSVSREAIPSGSADGAGIDQTLAVNAMLFMQYLESRVGGKAILTIGKQSVPLGLFVDDVASDAATNEEGEELAALFICAGVDLNSRQTSRETPLQLATLYELPNLVKLLLEKRANPFLAWHCTLTAAEIAEKRENRELTKILQDKEKEIDAWEASISDEAEKKISQVVLKQPTSSANLVALDKMFETKAKMRETGASQQSSKSSNECKPPGNVQPTQQQSSGEAAKASEAPQGPLSDTATATATHNGEKSLKRDDDNGDSAHVHAHKAKDTPGSIDAAATSIAATTNDRNNQEDTFDEQEENSGINEINEPYDDVHDN